MEFTCNAIKNETNIKERGLPLLAAQVMFNPAMQVIEDKRFDYPERRFIGYNTIAQRLMVVVFCNPKSFKASAWSMATWCGVITICAFQWRICTKDGFDA